MNKDMFRKVGVAVGSFGLCVISAFAEGTSADALISSAQGEVTGYITTLGTALVAVLTAGISLRALPWVARKIGSFFRT